MHENVSYFSFLFLSFAIIHRKKNERKKEREREGEQLDEDMKSKLVVQI
jgi:hypothetical protein